MTLRILWAQALDNASPDHIEVTGAEVTGAALTREAAVSKVYGVIERGKRLYEAGGVQLTEHRGNFVLEVPSTARDHVGRTAPIIYYSRYEANSPNTLLASIVDFAKKIGRDVPDRDAGQITLAIDALKKNTRLQTIAKLVLTVVVGLILLSLAIRIGYKTDSVRSSESNARPATVRMLATYNASAVNDG